MSNRKYLQLLLGALLVNVIVASYQSSPGYMDADYYFSGGIRLANGEGFSEIVLWNYLDEPGGLPNPSHQYWMPLASIVSWLGIEIFSADSPFEAAQIMFVVIASMVPLVTAKLAYSLTGKTKEAMLSGILAIFSGFYLAFVNTTETFGIYLLLGGLFCLAAGAHGKLFKWRAIILGAIAGLMHLSRADGFIWLGVAGIMVFLKLGEQNQRIADIQTEHYRNKMYQLAMVVGGYLIVMTPWFLRNYSAIGQIMSPGGTRALWITTYNELFSYPATLLTIDHWWEQGLSAILLTRWDALIQYLQSFIAVQGSIFLLPLIIAGALKLRRRVEIKAAVGGWLLTLGIMTVIFPVTGVQGGFFHSGAASQVVMWAIVPVGLNQFIDWGVNKRNWNAKKSLRVFGVSLVVFSIALSSFLFYIKLVGPENTAQIWDGPANKYELLEAYIDELGASDASVVMVLNPPGYFVANSRAAIVTPDGSIATMLIVAEKYNADYLLLEFEHPIGLNLLYDDPQDLPGIIFLGEYLETMIYELDPPN